MLDFYGSLMKNLACHVVVFISRTNRADECLESCLIGVFYQANLLSTVLFLSFT